MTRRLWIGGALTVPVVALDMGGHCFGCRIGLSEWIELLFATPVVLWAGWPFFVRGVQSVARRALNMFTLIALGTGMAWLYSVVATVTGRPAGLFRIGGGDHRAGAAGPGAGVARARRDLGRRSAACSDWRRARRWGRRARR